MTKAQTMALVAAALAARYEDPIDLTALVAEARRLVEACETEADDPTDDQGRRRSERMPALGDEVQVSGLRAGGESPPEPARVVSVDRAHGVVRVQARDGAVGTVSLGDQGRTWTRPPARS